MLFMLKSDNVPVFKFALNENLKEACEKHNKLTGESLTPENFLPTKADPEATGFDVRCAVLGGLDLKPECFLKIPLGIKMFAPAGWWLELRPRSSSMLKKHLHALYGVIDETFEHEMMFVAQYIPDACSILSASSPRKVEFGERIGQLVVVKRQEMTVEAVSAEEYKELCKARNAVRAGGFGSSGNR